MRRGTRADLPELLRIERAAHTHPWTPGMLAAEFDVEVSSVWVVLEGRGVVGFVILWWIVGEVTIVDVAVEPAAQRQGMGSAMIRAAIAAPGVDRVLLEVRVSNAPARALYHTLGFQEIGLRRRYYADNGEDACVMGLEVGGA